MATDPRTSLPKRFRPFFDQSMTQAELRYGAQESALNSVLAQLVNDYGRQSQAQSSAGQTVLGALKGADTQLNEVYSDAGLTPELRQNIAGSPTGQRLAGELASNRADVQQQLLGAQQGQQYIQQRLGEQYQDDVGQVSQQSTAMAKERGLYTSSLLDELISSDRGARSAANAAARKQAADEQQQSLDRATTTGNALIGQGITPIIGEDGSVSLGQPLPGGKADPNAPGNKPKVKPKKTPPTAISDFARARDIANGLTKGKPKSKSLRRWVGEQLLNGAPEIKGEEIYDTRKEIDGKPNPNLGKPVLEPDKLPDGTPNPRAGQKKRSESLAPIPQINNQPLVQAALDMVFDGHLSRDTIQKLHDQGYKVGALPGIKTGKDIPKPDRRLPVNNRQGTAPSRDQQLG